MSPAIRVTQDQTAQYAETELVVTGEFCCHAPGYDSWIVVHQLTSGDR
jgi:hypothetical protein